MSETSTACGFSTQVNSQASFGSTAFLSFSSQRRFSTMNSFGELGAAPLLPPKRFSSGLLRIMGDEVALDEGEKSPVSEGDKREEATEEHAVSGGRSGSDANREATGHKEEETGETDREAVPGVLEQPQAEEAKDEDAAVEGKLQTNQWQEDAGRVSLEYLDASLSSVDLQQARKGESNENDFLGENRGLERIEEHDDRSPGDTDSDEESWLLPSVCTTTARNLDDLPPWEQQHEEEEGIPVSIPLLPHSARLNGVQISGSCLDLAERADGALRRVPFAGSGVQVATALDEEEIRGTTDAPADLLSPRGSESLLGTLPTQMDVARGLACERTGDSPACRRSPSCDARRSSEDRAVTSFSSPVFPPTEGPISAAPGPDVALSSRSHQHPPEDAVSLRPAERVKDSCFGVETSVAEAVPFVQASVPCISSSPCQISRRFSFVGLSGTFPGRPPGTASAGGGQGDGGHLTPKIQICRQCPGERQAGEVVAFSEGSTIWLCYALDYLHRMINCHASEEATQAQVESFGCSSHESLGKGGVGLSSSAACLRGASPSVAPSGTVICIPPTHQSIIMGVEPCGAAAEEDRKALLLHTAPPVAAPSNYGGLQRKTTTECPPHSYTGCLGITRAESQPRTELLLQPEHCGCQNTAAADLVDHDSAVALCERPRTPRRHEGDATASGESPRCHSEKWDSSVSPVVVEGRPDVEFESDSCSLEVSTVGSSVKGQDSEASHLGLLARFDKGNHVTATTAVVSFSSCGERLLSREPGQKLDHTPPLSSDAAPWERRLSFCYAEAVRGRLGGLGRAHGVSVPSRPSIVVSGGVPGAGQVGGSEDRRLCTDASVPLSRTNSSQVFNLVRQLFVHIPLVIETIAEVSAGFSALSATGGRQSCVKIPQTAHRFVEPSFFAKSATPYSKDRTGSRGERRSSLSPLDYSSRVGAQHCRSFSSLPRGPPPSLLLPPHSRRIASCPLQLGHSTISSKSTGYSTPNNEAAWTSQDASLRARLSASPSVPRSMSAGKLEILAKSKAAGERRSMRRNSRLEKARAVLHLIPGLYSQHPPALSILLHDSALPLIFPLLESEVASFASLMVQQPPGVRALLEGYCFKRVNSDDSSEGHEEEETAVEPSPEVGQLGGNRPADVAGERMRRISRTRVWGPTAPAVEQRSNSFSTFCSFPKAKSGCSTRPEAPCLRSQFRRLRTESASGDGGGALHTPDTSECVSQGSSFPNCGSTSVFSSAPRMSAVDSAQSSPSCCGRRHITSTPDVSRECSPQTSLGPGVNENPKVQTVSCDSPQKGRSLRDLYFLFVGRQVPSLTVGQYVARLQQLSQLGAHESLVALLLVSRMLSRHPYFPLCALNAYRLLLTAFMTVTKAFSDRFYNNGLWARFGGVDVSELNRLEKAFLLLLDHRCFFTLEEFAAAFCLVKRVGPALPPQSAGRSSASSPSVSGCRDQGGCLSPRAFLRARNGSAARGGAGVSGDQGRVVLPLPLTDCLGQSHGNRPAPEGEDEPQSVSLPVEQPSYGSGFLGKGVSPDCGKHSPLSPRVPSPGLFTQGPPILASSQGSCLGSHVAETKQLQGCSGVGAACGLDPAEKGSAGIHSVFATGSSRIQAVSVCPEDGSGSGDRSEALRGPSVLVYPALDDEACPLSNGTNERGTRTASVCSPSNAQTQHELSVPRCSTLKTVSSAPSLRSRGTHSSGLRRRSFSRRIAAYGASTDSWAPRRGRGFLGSRRSVLSGSGAGCMRQLGQTSTARGCFQGSAAPPYGPPSVHEQASGNLVDRCCTSSTCSYRRRDTSSSADVIIRSRGGRGRRGRSRRGRRRASVSSYSGGEKENNARMFLSLSESSTRCGSVQRERGGENVFTSDNPVEAAAMASDPFFYESLLVMRGLPAAEGLRERAKRHQKKLRDPWEGLTSSVVVVVAKAGGQQQTETRCVEGGKRTPEFTGKVDRGLQPPGLLGKGKPDIEPSFRELENPARCVREGRGNDAVQMAGWDIRENPMANLLFPPHPGVGRGVVEESFLSLGRPCS